MFSKKIETFTLSPERKEALIQCIADNIVACPNILFAFIHGSFLENRPFRDLDIALYIKASNSRTPDYVVEANIESQLKTHCRIPFTVDARTLNFAPISFQYNVIRGRLVFERAPDSASAFIERTIARYLDIKPVLRHYAKEAFALEP